MHQADSSLRLQEPTNHWQSEAYARGSGVQGLGQRELQEESMAIEQAGAGLQGPRGIRIWIRPGTTRGGFTMLGLGLGGCG